MRVPIIAGRNRSIRGGFPLTPILSPASYQVYCEWDRVTRTMDIELLSRKRLQWPTNGAQRGRGLRGLHSRDQPVSRKVDLAWP